jgi:hypothetical protein
VIAPTPGSFSVVVKGILSNGKHFVRLAMYSFQPNGNMQEDFWHWDYDQGDQYSGQRLIGSYLVLYLIINAKMTRINM